MINSIVNTLGAIRRELIPDKGRFKINNMPLSYYGVFPHKEGMTVKSAAPITTYRSVPGRDGTWDVSLTDMTSRVYEPRRTVSLTVGSVGYEPDFIRSQTILGGMNGHEVTMRDTLAVGYWRGRLIVGDWTIERNKDGRFTQAWCELKMDADPHMYGDIISQPLAHRTDFHVRGNRLTWCELELTTDTTAPNLDISVTAGDWVRHLNLIATTTDKQWPVGTKLIVDMKNGIVGVNGNPFYNLDVTSDYWPLPSGPVTIETNAATGTLTYTPEWSI